jgi:hypothetical protein
VLLAAASRSPAADTEVDVGRRVFREGRLASGEPVTAVVAGDVPVSGSQLSCQSCHGRSGMGAGEGEIRVPPASALLFEPSPQRRRRAYDAASLARALESGRDPEGRALDPLMPRYRLPARELEALVAYLRGLSAAPSPGVSESEIRFATVMAGEVTAATREAVLGVLRRYVDDKNQQTRLESRRPAHGTPPGGALPSTFREWRLDVWEVAGPAESWRAQLEARYLEAPPFAMLSGLASGSWSELARFCESRELPCLLPATDQPGEAAAGDFYTLYFSRGLLLEADLVAGDLAAASARRVVQVVESGGADAALRLTQALDRRGTPVDVVAVDGGGVSSTSEAGRRSTASRSTAAGHLDLRALAPDEPGTAVVLWGSRALLARLSGWPEHARIYLSSSLLDGDPAGAAPLRSGDVRAAHPFVLPGEPDPGRRRFLAWLRARRVPLTDERRQAQAWFACLAANDAVQHAGRFFVRDYVLDILDHAQGLGGYLPYHPRAGFGPGQRHLSKGGYLLPLRAGVPAPREAAWIVP